MSSSYPLLSVGVSSVMAESRPQPYRQALLLMSTARSPESDSQWEMARERGSCVNSGSGVPATRLKSRSRQGPRLPCPFHAVRPVFS